MKTHGYLPIIKHNRDIVDASSGRNLKRFNECVTELVAALALVENQQVREIMTNYQACLIEYPEGNKSLGCEFPEKRFN